MTLDLRTVKSDILYIIYSIWYTLSKIGLFEADMYFIALKSLKSQFGDSGIETRLFYGDYQINQLDASGNIVASKEFTINSNPVCSFESLNMLTDG